MIATSKDVAERAGVSRSTVSQILNGRAELFTEETRARVAQAVADLGYLPSTAGRTLARGSSDIVIALIPNTTFGGNLQNNYEALTVELARRGLSLLLRFSSDSPESLERLAIGLKPRALLTMTPMPEAQRESLVARGVDVIEPDLSEGSDINAQVGALQARYLIEKGHRSLAYAHLRDSRADPFGAPRERAFVKECLARGLDRPQVINLDLSLEQASAALDELGAPGHAVACYNDDIAAALMHAAAVRGWSIPGDIAFIGMDNTPLSQFTTPPLTTISYDVAQVIAVSTQGILERLDRAERTAPQGTLNLDIIARESA
ncbi:LacI family DNA-binding transcriptional regulator [Demequina muriae]|uniref:LacI family DNA-binding transcriptional regulator n=1 Tax=Demequina muriae TaxID=3051664 RepID=A0ABT8GGB2_9MICO|nr:LacI family DNA-binding transcriptional regulator [Demequina sp. EGI L300058]MDN4480465.1 LacI family DNA-binding transcriptional regulator [Demequina sp. EGI L300058]